MKYTIIVTLTFVALACAQRESVDPVPPPAVDVLHLLGFGVDQWEASQSEIRGTREGAGEFVGQLDPEGRLTSFTQVTSDGVLVLEGSFIYERGERHGSATDYTLSQSGEALPLSRWEFAEGSPIRRIYIAPQLEGVVALYDDDWNLVERTGVPRGGE